jgi:hypothetical protein
MPTFAPVESEECEEVALALGEDMDPLVDVADVVLGREVALALYLDSAGMVSLFATRNSPVWSLQQSGLSSFTRHQLPSVQLETVMSERDLVS